jgi:hypothetical protein
MSVLTSGMARDAVETVEFNGVWYALIVRGDYFLERAGLRLLSCEAWLRRQPLSANDWYGVICAARAR